MNEDRAVLSAHEIAEYFGVNYQSVVRWRRNGQGPPWVRVGGSIAYRRSDLEAWLDAGGDEKSARKEKGKAGEQ